MQRYNYIIVGGGIVASHAAEVFAQHEHVQDHDLAIISADSALPYDRTMLSKDFLAGEARRPDVINHDARYYVDQGIDVYLDTKVTRIDRVNRVVHTDNGTEYAFGDLLLATGSELNKLDLPGDDLDHIHYLRNLEQSATIREHMDEAQNVVVIGGGYIGMEVASVAAADGKDVTMIFPEERLMGHRFFTPEMSGFFEDYFEQRGVTFVRGTHIKEFRGEDGRVAEVRTTDAGNYPADVVICGIGVTPNTDLGQQIGLQLADDGGYRVSQFLKTSEHHIYAAGDAANYPDPRFDKRMHVAHWNNAVEQGEYWAHHILGDTDEPFETIPYFFSDVFDLSYEFWGDPAEADTVIHRGDVDSGSFSAWYLKDNRVMAAFVMNRPDEERTMTMEWIESQNTIDPEILREGDKVYAAE